MYFINASSTISFQDSFQNEEWINNLSQLDENSFLISPNYKDFIETSTLRRMSKIIRMGLACTKDCINQSNETVPDAIIVGSGLGCLTDTEKFLKNTLTIEGLIPPTAFIQSSHNSIAGQLSLALKNHNYNMTHTQNSLSFEHSLIDAMLCLNENKFNVLVGASDENITIMDEVALECGLPELENRLTSGASFFMISKTKKDNSKALLIDSHTFGLNREKINILFADFLMQNTLKIQDIDLILSNTNGIQLIKEDEQLFSNVKILNYEKYCGYYFTNAAFGMHLAAEILSGKENNLVPANKVIKSILLFNSYKSKNIGLTLIKSVEA